MSIPDAFLAQISRDRHEEAKAKQLTLGELLYRLTKFDSDLLVTLDCYPDTGPGNLSSYRGYYEDLAIKPGGYSPTREEFEFRLASTIGKTFVGYKGGEYTMGSGTLLWVSEYGVASGRYVSDVVESDGRIVICTAEEEW